MPLLVKDANTTTQSLSTGLDSTGNLVPVHAAAAIVGGIATPASSAAPFPVVNTAGSAAVDGSGTVATGGSAQLLFGGVAATNGWLVANNSSATLYVLRLAWRAEPVEHGPQDRLKVAGIAVDRGDGGDHVKDLLKREIVADFMGTLRGDEERPAGGKHPVAAVAEHGAAAVRLNEQLSDRVLAGEEGEEPVQPGHEHRSWRLTLDGLGGQADGVDLIGVEGLEKLAAARKVAIQSRHADPGAPGNLGHRHLGLGVGERGTGRREDLVAVTLGVGPLGGRPHLVRSCPIHSRPTLPACSCLQGGASLAGTVTDCD